MRASLCATTPRILRHLSAKVQEFTEGAGGGGGRKGSNGHPNCFSVGSAVRTRANCYSAADENYGGGSSVATCAPTTCGCLLFSRADLLLRLHVYGRRRGQTLELTCNTTTDAGGTVVRYGTVGQSRYARSVGSAAITGARRVASRHVRA